MICCLAAVLHLEISRCSIFVFAPAAVLGCLVDKNLGKRPMGRRAAAKDPSNPVWATLPTGLAFTVETVAFMSMRKCALTSPFRTTS